MRRPSGTVTFLLTDIEGSTKRWETDAEAMRSELALHDEVLRTAVDRHGGWLFKHTGDGVCAAFTSARDAVDAAVAAQRRLRLPVRMGIATGDADERDGDYFGPSLHRAARVMGAGHGGMILVAESSAALVGEVGFLVDLGEHRLRDLAGPIRLYQVQVEGLETEFAPLRTVDSVPGNLPAQATSFVGRDAEVKELVELVRRHRLITLTGVGGVGKTRLAVHAAAELSTDFPDGVWLVELAPVGDPGAVPDVTAAVLGVAPGPGRSMTESIARALSGRHLLLVLDNCEHVLTAAGDLVETLLSHTPTITVIATSREGLGVGAEHLWPVPTLDVRAGAASAAVELFVERAQAVLATFTLDDEDETVAVTEICRRLDGIALAIELAAARMVSMSPRELHDRLDDRFRLLAGSRRALARHQTLRHAVGWSYDLLDEEERTLLGRCSVFANGFDLAAATDVCGGGADEYEVLDRLDSLVRKSLLVVAREDRHTRFGLLETIRQFAEDRLIATGTADELRHRHAAYYAREVLAQWERWNGPQQRIALDWVVSELANLRAGFRWATEAGELADAAAIAAHTTMMAVTRQRFEPAGWAEEILERAAAARLPQLTRLYTAASLCAFTGRPEVGVTFARTAVELGAEAGSEPFGCEWSRIWEANTYRYAGRIDECLEIFAELRDRPGRAHVAGLCGTLEALPAVGRAEEARAIAAETVAAAHELGQPSWIAWALSAYARAFAETDPARALAALHDGLNYTRENRLTLWAALMAREAAALEAVHGDLQEGLDLFEDAIDSFHRAGDQANLAVALAHLAVLFDRMGCAEIAATVLGSSTRHAIVNVLPNLPGAAEHLRLTLSDQAYEDCVAAGAAMEPADAVRYARRQIQAARRRPAAGGATTGSDGFDGA